jgi:hypothetical protein
MKPTLIGETTRSFIARGAGLSLWTLLLALLLFGAAQDWFQRGLLVTAWLGGLMALTRAKE